MIKNNEEGNVKKRCTADVSRTVFILSIITYPLLLFLVFYVYVNINSIVMAFTQSDIYGKTWFVRFENFKMFIEKVFTGNDLISQSIINSLKTFIINLVISLPLYIIFSYLVFKKCFMHNTIRVVVMLPQIISGFVVSMLFASFITGTNAPMTELFYKLGIRDQRGGGVELLFSNGYKYAFGTLIFYGIWVSFGTNLLVYPNAMKEIGPEILESAQLDGINSMWQELRYIILPLIFPTLSTFFIMGIAGLFTEQGYVLTFFPSGVPVGCDVYNMGYYYFIQVQSGASSNYNMMAAGGLVMTVIIAPVTILVRHLLEKYGPSTEV